MNRVVRKNLLVLLTVAIMLAGLPSFGQVVKGSISGTVVDPGGAVVSGAQVKATNSDTGATFATTSDSSGLFRFSLLPVGKYKVEITATGFKTAVQNGVEVVAGSDVSLATVKLSVGEVNIALEISADAPLVESSQAQITNTFSGQQLATFSGVQENQGLDNLALFVPGVSSVRDNGFSNTNGGAGFTSNGLRGRNNDQEIDGQNNNDNSVAGPALFMADTEFVQQYVIVTNNFGPEYGRNGGSVVNVITKSGGNAWHGSIYGNENNSVLNSLTTTQKNSAKLNQPPRANDEFAGFTIGGPWVKNKLFFFGGFDQEIVSQSNVFSTGLVTPTQAGLATLAGCFPSGPSAASVAALRKFGPFGISAGSPKASNPILTTLNGCAGVEVGGVSRILPAPIHTFNFVTREDLQLANDTISARYIFNRNNAFNAQDNGAAGYVVNIPALSQALLISETHNFTSRMVNELRLGFDRLNVQFGGNTIGTEPSVSQLDQALTNISFLDGASLGFGPNPVLPQGRVVNTWQAQDNWSYILGKHQLKAGVNWTYQQSPNIFLPNINGAYVYNSLSDFIANSPAQVNIDVGSPELGLKEYDTFIYFGDDWKVKPNLTLNLGITWSYYGQPINLLNQQDVKRETGPNPLWNPALPLGVRVDPKIGSYKNAIGPSAGFAYTPQWGGFITGNGKMTVRGGYRLSYDPAFYNIYLNDSTAAPHVLGATLFPGGANPLLLPAVPTGPNVRASLASAIPVGALDPRTLGEVVIPTNFRPDQVQGWSLGVEREITKNSAFEVRYVGNHATNLFQSVNANPFIADLAANFPNLVPAGVKPCPAAQAFDPVAIGRVNCNQGQLLSRNNSAFSDYNSLQLQFRANNLFKQLTVRTSYTFSKTTDNASEIFPTFGGGNTVTYSQNPLNVQSGGEHSISGLDFPHQWTINFSEQLPFFKEQRGILGHMLGGWTISADYILASGQPYTPFQLFHTNLSDVLNGQDFFDNGFLGAFNGGAGIARPFLGSLSAPGNSVAIFEGDACNLASFGLLPAVACTGGPANQLLSLNALNAKNPSAVVVTKNDVRFIENTVIAQQMFGTPFGNVPRNALRDAISNTGSFSVYKKFKLTERASFEFHATMINAFNHPNFATVIPFVENAGAPGFGVGFADPTLTGDSIPGSNIAASRRIYFGGALRF